MTSRRERTSSAAVDVTGLTAGGIQLPVTRRGARRASALLRRGACRSRRSRSDNRTMARLFGTDGVRGKAGEFPLDVADGSAAWRGAGSRAALDDGASGDSRSRFLAGRDTRESGAWIERELAFGMQQPGRVADERRHHSDAGHRVSDAAHGIHRRRRDLGVAQSVRGQRHQGVLGRRREIHRDARAARRVDHRGRVVAACRPATPRPVEQVDYRAEYLAHLREHSARRRARCAACASRSTAPTARRRRSRRGCSRSWASRCAASAASRTAATSTCAADRRRPSSSRALVVDGGYPLGIAYDGDGDRAIFVDETGKIVDGDAVMLMCAKQMKREGRLKGNAIVATVMSNIGLEIALREAGIDIVRCAVGDKYVMEEMIRRDLSLGGEQSGHVIFSEYLFTGDGLATVAERAADDGRDRTERSSTSHRS